MNRIALLALGVLLSGCAYTGHALRDAGAGGTGSDTETSRRTKAANGDAGGPLEAPLRPSGARVGVK